MRRFSSWIQGGLILLMSSSGVAADSQAPGQGKKIIFLGDSLTEGYQLESSDAFPSVVCQKLSEKKKAVTCVNSGVSGNTSKGLLSRLDWALKSKPDVAVLSIGSNDGLRGLSVSETKKNLIQIVKRLKEERIPILLTGQRMPPNYGQEFAKQFEKIFAEVAKSESLPLMPFLLEGVAGHPKLNLPDGIHPNKEGYRIVAENLIKYLEPLL